MLRPLLIPTAEPNRRCFSSGVTFVLLKFVALECACLLNFLGKSVFKPFAAGNVSSLLLSALIAAAPSQTALTRPQADRPQLPVAYFHLLSGCTSYANVRVRAAYSPSA